jgi:hypothetical protein
VAFTPQEKEKIRYHSGYLNAQPAASIQLGVPRPVQTLFLIEDAMDRLLPTARKTASARSSASSTASKTA